MALRFIRLVIPLLIIIPVLISSTRRYQRNQKELKREQLYQVMSFAQTDTLPAPAKEQVRWNQLLLFNQGNFAVIDGPNDKQAW